MAATPIQIGVSLEGSNPQIWRTLLVAPSASLADLHQILQTAVGWQDRHLHSFLIDDAEYGPIDEEEPEGDDFIDESTVTVGELATRTSTADYLYDFGDEWHHNLLLEPADPSLKLSGLAICLDGARSSPPEDCGGIGGYQDLLEVLGDPKHEDHRDLREWIGDGFDPENFDIKAVNRALSRPRSH